MPNITSEDFLAHYGVKGMKWGKSSAAAPNPKREARKAAKVQYKTDLKSAQSKQGLLGGLKPGKSYTPGEKAALKKLSRQQITVALGTWGAMTAGRMLLEGAANNAAAKSAARAATAGAQFNTRNMAAIGNLSSYTLRQGANGSWG